jgi:diguanylate cyclase (GGDEF)-like protein
MEAAGTAPETRSDLHQWVRERLHLAGPQEHALLDAIDNVFLQHERLWQQSKQEAIQAVSAGFTDRMNKMREELSARDATVSSIARYFEDLVADLTDRVHRDPKTRLMNFRRFIEQLEAFLALEQRGRWCAVGLVDITSFKWYNDTLGHALGDRIIERVARLLREQVRSEDLIAQEAPDLRGQQELHARFGGDEFCFLIPDLDHFSVAWVIAERFREAVERFDWSSEDARLVQKPVKVDVGVVCLMLGPVAERRQIARQLAHDLLARADKLMYEAKGEKASHVYPLRVRIEDGHLVEVSHDEHPE